MSDPHELTVRVQALNGAWETLGADRYRDIVPEGLVCSANRWGPDTCSFTLRRSAVVLGPDISTWTPAEIEVAGVVVWDGRIRATPTQDSDGDVISVQGQGWQYHLDDDVYDRAYVHTKLADYKDERGLLGADLTKHVQGAQVTSDRGLIQLGWAKGVDLSGGDNRAGVVLDLGPSNTAKRIVLDWESSNNTGAFTLYARGNASESSTPASAGDDAFTVLMNAGASGVSAGTFTTARRYVHLFVFYSGGATTTTADFWFRVKAVKVFADTAYESGNASILKLDQVANDALNQATVLLSTDRSEIKAGTFSIAELAVTDSTPRASISAANAYENYETKMLIGRRLAVRPRPSVPIYAIGEWSGADFQDASAGSGDDIINRFIVRGTGPDGTQLKIDRYTVQSQNEQRVRTMSSSASGAPVTPGNYGLTAITPIAKGRPTRVLLTSIASTGDCVMRVRVGDITGGNYVEWRIVVAGGVPAITPADTNQAFVVRRDGALIQNEFWLDSGTPTAISFSAQIDQTSATLADRRSFPHTRTMTAGAAITTAVGARIADLYLAAHATAPFAGSFRAIPGGVRRAANGSEPHPAHLLLDTGQLVWCTHRIDPDTGGLWRAGEIDTVTYTAESLSADVALNENRAGLDALLARYQVVVGQRA